MGTGPGALPAAPVGGEDPVPADPGTGATGNRVDTPVPGRMPASDSAAGTLWLSPAAV